MAAPDDATSATRQAPPAPPIKYLEAGSQLFNSGDAAKLELAAKYLQAADRYRDMLEPDERTTLDAYLKELGKAKAAMAAAPPTAAAEPTAAAAAVPPASALGTPERLQTPATSLGPRGRTGGRQPGWPGSDRADGRHAAASALAAAPGPRRAAQRELRPCPA